MYGIRSTAAALLSMIVASWGCEAAPSHTVLVDVRTNLRPSVEFAAVDVSLRHTGGTETDSKPALSSDDWARGVRVAELTDLGEGPATLQVVLRDGAGDVVVSRPVDLVVSGDTVGVTVVMTRDCLGVVCPRAGDDATRVACVAGTCVDPACHAGAPEACGIPTCESDLACGLRAGCAVPRCLAGVCAPVLDDALCADATCDPRYGCVGTDFDGGVPDEHDGGVCPFSETTPYPGAACNAATTDCVSGCADAECQYACLDADPNPDCALCVSRNFVDCAARMGCQAEWNCYAACAAPACSGTELYRCAAVGCAAELAPFNECFQRVGSASCLDASNGCFE